MTDEQKVEVIKALCQSHTEAVVKAIHEANASSAMPQSVHEYTEMYLDKIESIIRAL